MNRPDAVAFLQNHMVIAKGQQLLNVIVGQPKLSCKTTVALIGLRQTDGNWHLRRLSVFLSPS